MWAHPPLWGHARRLRPPHTPTYAHFSTSPFDPNSIGILRQQAWYKLESTQGTTNRLKVAWDILHDPVLSPPLTRTARLWLLALGAVPPLLILLGGLHFRDEIRARTRTLLKEEQTQSYHHDDTKQLLQVRRRLCVCVCVAE